MAKSTSVCYPHQQCTQHTLCSSSLTDLTGLMNDDQQVEVTMGLVGGETSPLFFGKLKLLLEVVSDGYFPKSRGDGWLEIELGNY